MSTSKPNTNESPQEWLERCAIPVPESGCWLFTGSANRFGYGLVHMNGGTTLAHRLAWAIFNGPIPDGLCVCHICDVRLCVNPKHFFLGTLADNLRDMYRKGRNVIRSGYISPNRRDFCIRGHKFKRVHWKKSGVCVQCSTMYMRRWRTKKLMAAAVSK